VVHRDIKPDNVYLAHKDGEPVIKILDFGIAKLYAGSADDPASTRAGLTVGTPAYLSPEQAVGGEITPASDLYSASIVLYEMLAGRAPFEDKDPLAMLGAHVGRRPPAFADVAPGVDIPAPLEEIVQRGLRKTAGERINTAADYLAMLDAFSPPLPPVSPRLLTAPIMSQGDRSLSTPLPGTPAIGVPTPVSGTPPIGVPTPVLGAPLVHAPVQVSGMAFATPLPATTDALPAAPATPVSLEMAPLPRAMRAGSLADASEPIPLSWIVRSGVVVGLVIVGAIVLAIATHCTGSEPAPRARSSAVSPPAPASSAPPPAVPPPAPRTKPPAAQPPPSSAAGTAGGSAQDRVPGAADPTRGAMAPATAVAPAAATGRPAPGAAKPLDRDAQLKLGLHDLEQGKTCADRRASISKLVELHDARALPPLRRARVRTGARDESNACLKADAERAIKELGGTLK
jgi:hypothetical protein